MVVVMKGKAERRCLERLNGFLQMRREVSGVEERRARRNVPEPGGGGPGEEPFQRRPVEREQLDQLGSRSLYPRLKLTIG